MGHTAKPKVLVLSTGGTLSMRPVVGGPLKADMVLEDLSTWVPELESSVDIHLEIIANLDSSLMKPDLWLTLAKRIEAAHDNRESDGIVIIHGTDTMAYTASALSFLLPSLDMPVVLTGSQRPLAEPRSDARTNLIGAVEAALGGPVEVMVFFNNHAYRGNRVTKSAIGDFDGFDSPNCRWLGKAGINWDWRRYRYWPPSRRPAMWPPIPESLPPTPLLITWVPGLDIRKLAPVFSEHWAVILEAFGTGNLPFSEDMGPVLKHYLDGGGLLFIKSQVAKGRVLLELYEPGQVMMDMGIVGGGDMTREAMVTKLMVLKGMGMKPERIRNTMAQSIAGELTEFE